MGMGAAAAASTSSEHVPSVVAVASVAVVTGVAAVAVLEEGDIYAWTCRRGMKERRGMDKRNLEL